MDCKKCFGIIRSTLSLLNSVYGFPHNPKVAGSNPAPATRPTFATLASLAPGDYPNEKMCSVALRLSFGAFRYYAGGDLVHETNYGRLPWADIESAVARACGRVDVASANHHGYVNGCGPEYIRQLQPRAFVISAWDSAHPTIPSLDNMQSRELSPDERGVFATALKPENIIATKRLAELQSGNEGTDIETNKGRTSSAKAAINRVSVPFRTALYGTGVQPSRIGSSEERIDLHAGKASNYAECIFGSTTLILCSHASRNLYLRIAYVRNRPAVPKTSVAEDPLTVRIAMRG